MTAPLARARLTYGEWLRREGRRVDAREQLRAAYEAFVAMGAVRIRRPGSARAAGDRREGPQAPRRQPATSSPPRRSRSRAWPATAAPTRRSAPSSTSVPRTVEWHLRKVFAKLGITSRKGLHDALPRPERDGTPAGAARG